MAEMDFATLFTYATVLGGFAVSLISWLLQKRKETELMHRELYQQIELASIDLFRFEGENEELISYIWENKEIPPRDSAKYYCITEYTGQILNLFEMTCRFKKQKVIEDQVFGSWVKWFFDMWFAPNFPSFWEAMQLNYTDELQAIMACGRKVRETFNESNRPYEEMEESLLRTFYNDVGIFTKSKVIANWLDKSKTRA
ncbi:MAG: hypothetical protein JW839_11620 [Candidatus Lokiarchaeota archaeon]|nr:hypothetical protein [Candidatus Lokiarchaeota archaeon]